MMRINDRHDNEFCLGPTHEEMITTLVKNEINSYRDVYKRQMLHLQLYVKITIFLLLYLAWTFLVTLQKPLRAKRLVPVSYTHLI